MRRKIALAVLSLGILAAPAFAETDVLATMDALVQCAKVGIEPSEVIPKLAGDDVAESGVMVIELETLRAAYWIQHPDAVQASVDELIGGYGIDWTPAYFRSGRMSVDEEVVVATGILSESARSQIADRLHGAGVDTLDTSQALGWVVLFRDLVPEYLRSREVMVRLTDGETIGWPHLPVEGDLNIPSFTWRLTLKNGADNPVIAEWPVVVGKTTTRTPRTSGTVYCTIIHHYPSWTDPETGKYVSPGAWNPLGIWKLMPTEPKKVIWYYHGTNQPKLLNREYRAFSHGCIRNRNENIAALALFMLTRNAGEKLATGQLSGKLHFYGEKKNRQIALFDSVPATNRYHCLEVRKDAITGEPTLFAYPDVYWLRTDDGVTHRTVSEDFLAEQLKAVGIDPAGVDPSRISTLMTQLRATKSAAKYSLTQLTWMLEPSAAPAPALAEGEKTVP